MSETVARRVRLDAIAFDAGTQIRAALDQAVVADYAEAMTDGAQFPPVMLFHDGNTHYIGDGFHRFMAAQRLQWRHIDAIVQPGTKEDALWFALGANRTNGKRLTEADKTHAIALARAAWPEKMQREIAAQVGCHPSLVSRVYQNTTSSETVSTGRQRQSEMKRETIRRLIAEGQKADQIAKHVGVSRSRVSEIRVEMGLSNRVDQSRKATQERRDRMRAMAAEGHTSRQIAHALGLSDEGCRQILRDQKIDVPGDNATKNSKRHDSNRIVDRIVMDAENLTEGVNLIEFGDLDRGRIAEWLKSLGASRDKFGGFIRRLMKEQQNHGEAA
jgi:ParB-like chromosome segregation protein Spo0J